MAPENFAMAFTVQDFKTGKILNDTGDFTYIAMLIEGTSTEIYISVRKIGTHLCTEEERKNEFYPP